MQECCIDICKINLEIDPVVFLESNDVQVESTYQALNHGAAQLVIRGVFQAAPDGQLLVIQTLLIAGEIAVILAVEVANTADGRHTEADQIAMVLADIPQQVVLQVAVFLDQGEVMVRQDEVIHANEAITCSGQLFDATLQHFQLEFGARQLGGIDSTVGTVPIGTVFMVGKSQPIRL